MVGRALYGREREVLVLAWSLTSCVIVSKSQCIPFPKSFSVGSCIRITWVFIKNENTNSSQD